MKHFWFAEEVSGEEFLVGAYTRDEAEQRALEIGKDIAEQWCDPEDGFEVVFCGEVSDWEAEASGLDEY